MVAFVAVDDVDAVYVMFDAVYVMFDAVYVLIIIMLL